MSCRLINTSTGEKFSVTLNKKLSLSDSHKMEYDFDSAEEALLHIIVFKGCYSLHSNVIYKINEISKQLVVYGVKIEDYFTWGNHIFSKLGKIYSYHGEMDVNKNNI